MSNVPLARAQLAALGDRLRDLQHHAEADRLDEIADLLWRRRQVRPRAPVASARVDAETARQMRVAAFSEPHLSQQQIADRFGTNAGRVSEALHGDR